MDRAMTTLKTICTIELSNICNLKCLYCVNRLLVKHSERKPGIMSDEVFNATLDLLRQTMSMGTQKEVNMNGNGESTLDTQIIPRICAVRDVIGHNELRLSTNGLTMTEGLIKALKDSGLDQLDVSVHSPYHARKTVDLMLKVGMPGVINGAAISSTHNWCDQIEEEHRVKNRIVGSQCDPLIEGRGYVLAEGGITPCCYDYQNLGVFGTVLDEDIFDVEYGPYELCKNCHQVIPMEAAT